MAELAAPVAAWGFPKGLLSEPENDAQSPSQIPLLHTQDETNQHHDSIFGRRSTSNALEHEPSKATGIGLNTEPESFDFPNATPNVSYQADIEHDAQDSEMERLFGFDDTGFSWYADPTGGQDDGTSSDTEDTESASETESVGHAFGLRRNARLQNGRNWVTSSSWVDKDDTGDYDPAEEQRQLTKKRRRVSKDPKVCNVHSTSENSKREKDHAVSHQIPATFAILKFRRMANKLAFAKLISRLASAAKSCDTQHQRRLRNTETRDQHFSAINEEYHLPDDLTGHPVGRRCYECAGLAEQCSLLDDERDWPCRTCIETGNDCDLITPPIRKLACQLCKRSRIQCSFSTSRNQGDTCQACAQRGFRCVAGPVKDFIQPRIRYDRDWKLDPLITRKATKNCEPCAECHQAGQDCSLTQENDGAHTCALCSTKGLPCTMGESPISHSPPKSTTPTQTANHEPEPCTEVDPSSGPPSLPPPPNRPTAASFPEPSPKPRPSNNHPFPSGPCPEPSSSIIQTSFAHPIEFNATSTDDEAPDAVNDCHFCREPTYAILGLGRTRVAVIEHPDGPGGWLETCGGHRVRADRTRLCVICTTRRLQILMCAGHEVRSIPRAAAAAAMAVTAAGEGGGGGEGEGDVEVMERERRAAVEILIGGELKVVNETGEGEGEGKGGEEELKTDLGRYCDLCPSLAEHECAAEGGAGDTETTGCGLKLCERCMLVLVGTHDGDLGAMLAGIDAHEPDDARPLGFRADCEFLRQDGPLMKYFAWMCQQ